MYFWKEKENNNIGISYHTVKMQPPPPLPPPPKRLGDKICDRGKIYI